MAGEIVRVGQSSQVGGELSSASRKEVMRGAEDLRAPKPSVPVEWTRTTQHVPKASQHGTRVPLE